MVVRYETMRHTSEKIDFTGYNLKDRRSIIPGNKHEDTKQSYNSKNLQSIYNIIQNV